MAKSEISTIEKKKAYRYTKAYKHKEVTKIFVIWEGEDELQKLEEWENGTI